MLDVSTDPFLLLGRVLHTFLEVVNQLCLLSDGALKLVLPMAVGRL